MANHKSNGSKVLRTNKIQQIINHVTDLKERKSLQKKKHLTSGTSVVLKKKLVLVATDGGDWALAGTGSHGWRGLDSSRASADGHVWRGVSSSPKKIHNNVSLLPKVPMTC